MKNEKKGEKDDLDVSITCQEKGEYDCQPIRRPCMVGGIAGWVS
jgi:hypothetical protein